MKTQPRVCFSILTHSVTKKDYLSSCVFLRHPGLSLRLPSSFLVLSAVSILHSEFFTSRFLTLSAGAAAPPPGCFHRSCRGCNPFAACRLSSGPFRHQNNRQ